MANIVILPTYSLVDNLWIGSDFTHKKPVESVGLRPHALRNFTHDFSCKPATGIGLPMLNSRAAFK